MLTLTCVPNGLSSIELLTIDKKEVRRPIYKAVMAIFGEKIIESQDEKGTRRAEWLMLETGITDPIDLIDIGELTVLCRARIGHINKMAAEVLMADEDLNRYLSKKCKQWHIQPQELIKQRKTHWNKILRVAARKIRQDYFLKKYAKNILESEVPMGEQMDPIWIKSGLDNVQIRTLTIIREDLICGRKEWSMPCKKCLSGDTSTLRHMLVNCTEATIRSKRKLIMRELSDKEQNSWNSLREETILRLTSCEQTHMKLLTSILNIYIDWTD